MKKKPNALPSKAKSKQKSQPISRFALIIALYLLLFFILDLISHSYEDLPGIVAWYPPAGFTYAFLLVFGLGFTPVVFLSLLISSIFIYRMPQSPYLLLLWALTVSLIYGAAAAFLRKRIHIDWQLRKFRDVSWFIFTALLVSALLAVLTVLSSTMSSDLQRSEILQAIFHWWIGETVGVLTITPFLLSYVMPWLKRFTEGQPLELPSHRSFPYPTLVVIGQGLSIVLMLFWVFGPRVFEEYQPFYLIFLPLIWIAIDHGFKGVTLGIVVSNFGMMLAMLVFRSDLANLGELQLLMILNCIVALLMGAVVTERKQSDETFQKSEERFKSLVEHSLEEISLVDSDGTLTYESPTTRRPLGYPSNSLLGYNIIDLFHPDDRATAIQLLKQVGKHPGSIKEASFRLRHKNGTWRWMEGSLTNLLNEPAVKSVVINYRDVTERKLGEIAVQNSREELNRLLNSMAEGAYGVDIHGVCTFVNRACLLILGYQKDYELLGKHMHEIIHHSHSDGSPYPSSECRMYESFKTGQPANVNDEVFWRKDGVAISVEYWSYPIVKDSVIIGSIATFIDITERKKAEQEIVNLAKFPSENPNPIIRLSKKGKVMYANPASSVILKMWGCAVGDKAPQFWRDLVVKALTSRQIDTIDIEYQENIYAIIVTPVSGQDYVNLYANNITARKQAEEKIIINNDELSMLFILSHSLAEADTLDDILNLVNQHAVESIHTTFARIALVEGENYIMRAAYPLRPVDHDLGVGERNPATSLPYSQRILEKNEAMVLRANDPDISAEEKKFLLLNFAQSLCIIPLRMNDSAQTSEKLLGLLMLGEARNEDREPFTPEKIRLAQSIGDSAAIAIRRMLLREQTERQLNQLVSLTKIDLAIISSSDMKFSLGVLLLQAVEQLKVDAADVWQFNPALQMLEFVTSHGFQTMAFGNAKSLHLLEGFAGKAVLERRIIHVPDLRAQNVHPLLTKSLAKEPYKDYYAVPLIVKDQVKGVMEVFHRTEIEATDEWINFLHTLANQAAIAIDNSSLFNDLEGSNAELTKAYDATIQGWSKALDLRDKETEGHTQRVSTLTTKLGRQFGMSEEELVHVRRGALLHDIGKMGVPDGILLKPGPLTDEEWVIMRKHPTFAYELLYPIHYLRPAVDIPYCHHEMWDGKGYPRGLSGTEIPLAARIFAVVDVWDALTSDRPYRAAWPEEKVLDHIRSLAGTHFDPQVAKICLQSGFLTGKSKNRKRIKYVQWSDKFSVGVKEFDRHHQQLIMLLNQMISATGTSITHSETISGILVELTRYARLHFKAEEKLMEAYGYPGFGEQKIEHRAFRKKTADFSTAASLEDGQTQDALLKFLTNWLTHHILVTDMAYRSFFNEKGIG